MLIATSFSTYFEQANENISLALELIKKDGFEAVGIVLIEPLDFYLPFLQTLLDSKIKFCIHANMIDTNISSLNSGIRKESISQVRDAIILTSKLNAKIVTFHPGKFRNVHMIQEAYFLLDNAIEELIAFAQQMNVILCLENMEPSEKELCVSLAQVQKVLHRHPNLGFTLDLAHLALQELGTDGFFNYFDSVKSRISHIHISGVNQHQSHVEVSLPESEFDMRPVIKRLSNFEGIVRIENRERKKNIESRNFILEVIK